MLRWRSRGTHLGTGIRPDEAPRYGRQGRKCRLGLGVPVDPGLREPGFDSGGGPYRPPTVLEEDDRGQEPRPGTEVGGILMAGESSRGNGAVVATKRSIIDIETLTEAERIQLAEDLWDSIAPDSPELALPPWMETLLDERLAELERDPDSGEPWEAVVQEIRARLRQRG